MRHEDRDLSGYKARLCAEKILGLTDMAIRHTTVSALSFSYNGRWGKEGVRMGLTYVHFPILHIDAVPFKWLNSVHNPSYFITTLIDAGVVVW